MKPYCGTTNPVHKKAMGEHQGPRCWVCNGEGRRDVAGLPTRYWETCWQCKGTGVFPNHAGRFRSYATKSSKHDEIIRLFDRFSLGEIKHIIGNKDSARRAGWDVEAIQKVIDQVETPSGPIKWTKDEQAVEPFDKDKLVSFQGRGRQFTDEEIGIKPTPVKLTPLTKEDIRKLGEEAMKQQRPVTSKEITDIPGSPRHPDWPAGPAKAYGPHDNAVQLGGRVFEVLHGQAQLMADTINAAIYKRRLIDWSNEQFRKLIEHDMRSILPPVGDKHETTEIPYHEAHQYMREIMAVHQANNHSWTWLKSPEGKRALDRLTDIWARGFKAGQRSDKDQTHAAKGWSARLARAKAWVRKVLLSRPNKPAPGQPKRAQTRHGMTGKAQRAWSLWLVFAWLVITGLVGGNMVITHTGQLTNAGLLLILMLLVIIAGLVVRYFGE